MRRALFLSIGAMVVSWAIVAFGQPAWVNWLGIFSSIFGFALFWKGMFFFQRSFHRFLAATFWFFAVQLVQLSWMTASDLQGTYTWFVWLFFALGMGLQFGAVSLLIKPTPSLSQCLGIPALWVLMEYVRLYFLAGFTWNPVGLALTWSTLSSQMVSLFGIYGLSFIVMATNLLFLALLQRHYRYAKKACCLLFLPYLFGVGHLSFHRKAMQEANQLSILLLQTGITPDTRSQAHNALTQWQTVLGLLSPYVGRQVDLVVMPEGVTPYLAEQLAYPWHAARPIISQAFPGLTVPSVNHFASNSHFCSMVAKALRAHVIAGFDDSPDGTQVYNGAIFIHPEREGVADRYGKRVLLPFVETIPGEWAVPLCRFYGIHSSFCAGKEAKIFAGPVPIGLSICYEETFGNLTRENRRKGAQLLVTITNDGWYPRSKLPMQHFTHGRLRALENGIPLVRSSHTGMTVAIDSLGRTVAQLGDGSHAAQQQKGVLLARVPNYHYQTLYLKTGDAPLIGASLCLALFFLWRRRRP